MILNSPAKLNLHLQVLKKRNDGFHEVRTVLQLIDLSDQIELELTDGEIKLIEKTENIKDNIILKAAKTLKEKTKTSKGATISVSKNIPLQKGLGGGSSDAATTLIGLNYLWETKMKENDLQKIALDLGTDVPFFIHGKNTWAKGRGEIFEEINLPTRWYLLIFPKTNISTKFAFEEIKVDENLILNKGDFLKGHSVNSFMDWAKEQFPEINSTVESLNPFGIPKLTGTGSALFLSFKNKEDAMKANKKIPKGIVVRSLDDSPLRQLLE
tara:strand:+ start:838 stop:1644 length:807 start_codon:yes stop_codon:yes gene_type:complete